MIYYLDVEVKAALRSIAMVFEAFQKGAGLAVF
jgi:hypothetical protein